MSTAFLKCLELASKQRNMLKVHPFFLNIKYIAFSLVLVKVINLKRIWGLKIRETMWPCKKPQQNCPISDSLFVQWVKCVVTPGAHQQMGGWCIAPVSAHRCEWKMADWGEWKAFGNIILHLLDFAWEEMKEEHMLVMRQCCALSIIQSLMRSRAPKATVQSQ